MKHVKMVLYGEPGVGKSVFASKAPNPFFITTDGNYEFLEDFGAKPEDHIQVNSWAEAKKAFTKDFSNYETIVVDLTEDLFKWCEYEYCRLNGYEHVSDPGFAKGYDITRNDFFINLCKILNQEKNVILIMHGVTSSVKDRRGIEHTKYYPTNRIPDKVMDMIEGRVRYFLRAYMKAEEDANGKLTKKRYLSLVPKENEYGILRGIDENTIHNEYPELDKPLGETLLTPTKIYVKPILDLISKVDVKAISHITGGGFYENIPRMLKDGLTVKIKKDAVPVLPIFKVIERVGNIPEHDMFNTFNMGIGMIVAVSKENADKAVETLKAFGEDAVVLGEVIEGNDGVVFE